VSKISRASNATGVHSSPPRWPGVEWTRICHWNTLGWMGGYASIAFGNGVSRHGLLCLGCCWALMLVGFAVGVANLWWMAVLTAVMVFEKSGRGGDRGVIPIGIALIALGGLVLIVPSWPVFIAPS
jgi:hypothetical protein